MPVRLNPLAGIVRNKLLQSVPILRKRMERRSIKTSWILRIWVSRRVNQNKRKRKAK